jgi:hypothetical protein
MPVNKIIHPPPRQNLLEATLARFVGKRRARGGTRLRVWRRGPS